MFKVITDGEDLEGKTIKYCNMIHNGDCDECNIICTQDNEIMFFSISEDLRIICLNLENIKRYLCFYPGLEREFLDNKIISNEELDEIKKEFILRKKEEEERKNQYEYKEYLRLKNKFESK